MLAVPHMLVGAAVGKTLKRPALALPVAFGSHFLLDWVPHLDSHRIFGIAGGSVTRPEAIMGVLDFLFGAGLVIWLSAGRRDRKTILLSALAAILIDLVDNVPPWSGWFRASRVGSAISAFHHGFQHNVTLDQWPLGLGTQVVAIAAATLTLLRPRQAKDG
jgi:hypothetical protein